MNQVAPNYKMGIIAENITGVVSIKLNRVYAYMCLAYIENMENVSYCVFQICRPDMFIWQLSFCIYEMGLGISAFPKPSKAVSPGLGTPVQVTVSLRVRAPARALSLVWLSTCYSCRDMDAASSSDSQGVFQDFSVRRY